VNSSTDRSDTVQTGGDRGTRAPCGRAPRPLRLLHVISHASGGGAETELAYLAEAHARAGHDVHVAFLHAGPTGPPPPQRGDNPTWHDLGPAGNHDPRLWFRLVCLVRRIGPHIVQTWTPQMDILVGLSGIPRAMPWILWDGSYGPTETHRWKTLLRRRLARRAAAITPNSEAGCAYWRRHCRNVACRLVPNALPLDRIDRPTLRNGRIDAAAADWEGAIADFMRDGPCIVYAGRLDPEKNVPTLLHAVRLVRQTRPVRLLICGAGSQQADLERRIRKAGLTDAVRLIGHVAHEKVWACMRRAALFVNISRFEGRPNAVLEAMACRCPVLVSDIPAHREFLDASKAVFVDGSSARSVADGIERLLGDAEGTARRVEAARRAVADYSVETTARMYENLYRQLSTRRAASAGAADDQPCNVESCPAGPEKRNLRG